MIPVSLCFLEELRTATKADAVSAFESEISSVVCSSVAFPVAHSQREVAFSLLLNFVREGLNGGTIW